MSLPIGIPYVTLSFLEEEDAQYLVVADGRAFRIYGHGNVDIYLEDINHNMGRSNA